MKTNPQGSVWAKPCPMPTITPFIYRTAAAVTVLLPMIVPGCCVLARSAA
jgi:hypothetical protein